MGADGAAVVHHRAMVVFILSLLGPPIPPSVPTRTLRTRTSPSAGSGQPPAHIEPPPPEQERSRVLVGPFPSLVRWADVLVALMPHTVHHWHRTGFRLFWRCKSRSHHPDEGSVAPEVRRLIRQIAEANACRPQ